MKKISKLLFVVIMVCVLFVSGCNKKSVDDAKENTVASKLVTSFNETIKNEKNLEKVATKISKHESIKITVDVVEVEEGFLTGFDKEINGFKKAYSISPIISTQPFVAYVFESDDVKKLEKDLKESANKRWNICTEADDLEISVVDNYIFIVMSPKSFGE